MSQHYFVTYDLVSNDLDTKPINERGEAVRLLLRQQLRVRQTLSNQWYVESSASAEEIKEMVKAEFGLDDRLVVVEWLGQMEDHWSIEHISDRR